MFEDIEQVQIISDKWKDEYNSGHPHQSLGGKTPIEFKYSRRKIIDAYDQVKAKMNGSQRSPALTISPPSMGWSLRDYSNGKN